MEQKLKPRYNSDAMKKGMRVIKKNFNFNTKDHLANKQLFYKKYESAIKNSRPSQNIGQNVPSVEPKN